MSLRCTYCFRFSTSCSQVSSNCNSLFSLGSCWWDWDGDPVVWAEQFMAISHHSPGLEPRAATPVSSPGKSATWKTAVLCDNNNGIAWRDNVTNATVLEQTGSMTMHFIQSQHRWNLQFLTILAVMKPLHPDLRWSHQFFALSPYTFTIAQNCPTPSPSPTYSTTTKEIQQPILTQDPIYPATFKMSGSSLIIITLGTVFLLSFVLCAKTKEK